MASDSDKVCRKCGRVMADAVTYPTTRNWKCWWCEERAGGSPDV